MFHGFISSRVARARSEKGWATLSRLRGTVHGRVKVSPSRAHIEPWVPREEGVAVLFNKVLYREAAPGRGGGGGDLPQKFVRLFGPQFCLKIMGGGGGGLGGGAGAPPLDLPLLQENFGFLDS